MSYYQKGYGLALNYHMACPLLSELITVIKEKVSGDPARAMEVAKLRFAHAETIIPLIAILGLFNESNHDMKGDPTKVNHTLPLCFSEIQEEMEARTWRTSLFASFAGNVAMILYKCGEDYSVFIPLIHY